MNKIEEDSKVVVRAFTRMFGHSQFFFLNSQLFSNLSYKLYHHNFIISSILPTWFGSCTIWRNFWTKSFLQLEENLLPNFNPIASMNTTSLVFLYSCIPVTLTNVFHGPPPPYRPTSLKSKIIFNKKEKIKWNLNSSSLLIFQHPFPFFQVNFLYLLII